MWPTQYPCMFYFADFLHWLVVLLAFFFFFLLFSCTFTCPESRAATLNMFVSSNNNKDILILDRGQPDVIYIKYSIQFRSMFTSNRPIQTNNTDINSQACP